jgi:hypothetical protein
MNCRQDNFLSASHQKFLVFPVTPVPDGAFLTAARFLADKNFP